MLLKYLSKCLIERGGRFGLQRLVGSGVLDRIKRPTFQHPVRLSNQRGELNVDDPFFPWKYSPYVLSTDLGSSSSPRIGKYVEYIVTLSPSFEFQIMPNRLPEQVSRSKANYPKWNRSLTIVYRGASRRSLAVNGHGASSRFTL